MERKCWEIFRLYIISFNIHMYMYIYIWTRDAVVKRRVRSPIIYLVYVMDSIPVEASNDHK